MTTNQKITVFGIITLIGLFFIYNFYFSPSAICINTYKEATYKDIETRYPDKELREEYIYKSMNKAKVSCTKPK